MNERWEPSARDRALARWAGAFLSGSALIGLGLLVAALFAMNPLGTLSAHPVYVAAAVVAIVAFVKSFFALAQLVRQHTTVQPRRLWHISLLCNLAVVAIIVVAFGWEVGFALSLMELAAVALHVVALVKPAPTTA